MPETLILGGGVIGLSLAYELAGQGLKVRIIDRNQPGRKASWAAAGILPPCKFRTRASPPEWLAGFSGQLHAEWSARLREETGIDNGYRRSGGIHLAETDAASAELLHTCERWRREGITVRWLHASDLDKVEPAAGRRLRSLPFQGRCPLRRRSANSQPQASAGAVSACVKRGVEISPGIEAHDFDVNGQRVTAVQTNMGAISADKIVIATGAWTAGHRRPLEFEAGREADTRTGGIAELPATHCRAGHQRGSALSAAPR